MHNEFKRTVKADDLGRVLKELATYAVVHTEIWSDSTDDMLIVVSAQDLAYAATQGYRECSKFEAHRKPATDQP